MSNLQRIIWLASYPKSGNTWLRSLLANYFMPVGQAPDINNLNKFTTGDVRRDFYDAAVGGRYHADSPAEWILVRPQALRLIAASKPNHHFVKTHCQASQYLGTDLIPPEVTAAAIYILRNPFDLAPSFARHQGSDIDTTIDRMLDTEAVMGMSGGIYDAIGRWDAHANSWLSAPGLQVHLIRYEDMLSRPGPTVRALLEKFLKLKVDKPKLAMAVQKSSFKALKTQEERVGFREKPERMKSFFNKGKAGSWREDLTPEQVGRIRSAFENALEKWYPEMLDETEKFSMNA